ncbi:hypothetical protein PG990_014508 [Apiospora arundinis]
MANNAQQYASGQRVANLADNTLLQLVKEVSRFADLHRPLLTSAVASKWRGVFYDEQCITALGAALGAVLGAPSGGTASDEIAFHLTALSLNLGPHPRRGGEDTEVQGADHHREQAKGMYDDDQAIHDEGKEYTTPPAGGSQSRNTSWMTCHDIVYEELGTALG